ncbi:MAG TPA: DUF692 domain-containing protein [Polyangiaceae bacterium]|nr:DUF692 domain-containing protein [Polyangiaceae bacterium]
MPSFRARHHIPDLGVGVGFRPKHAADVLDRGGSPDVRWYEVISENFMSPWPAARGPGGGRPAANLARLRAGYTVIPHGVAMSIGSVAPLDDEYLARLRVLVDALDPPYFTDHACFCRASGLDLHDLLPLPYTKEALAHVTERVKRVQDAIERPFALENVSSYLSYRESEMPEWEFLAELAERADCGLLFDVNNVFVSAYNHGFDPAEFIDAVPADRVVQIHLAGHQDRGAYLLDNHGDHVRREVWALYERAIRRVGAVSTLIEWDENIPAFEVLAREAALAAQHRDRALDLATAIAAGAAP